MRKFRYSVGVVKLCYFEDLNNIVCQLGLELVELDVGIEFIVLDILVILRLIFIYYCIVVGYLVIFLLECIKGISL